MKICTIVGARPQFIKAAAVSNVLRRVHKEVLIHTGQHYDNNMSDIFFEELNIPHPNYNLGIQGGSHGEMTGQMLIEIENVLMEEKPDMVLVYGDTNSTLAAALAAAKLCIPICHVEAGARLGDKCNPEEINRIMTDHVASVLITCTESSNKYLQKEGITENVFFCGDPMYDAFCNFSAVLNEDTPKSIVDFSGIPVTLPQEYYLLTCHRQENTATDEPLTEIFLALEQLEAPTIYPVHPRNQERAQRLVKELKLANITLTQPVGYLQSIYLVRNANKIITDSGGLQREAFWARVQCVTLLDHVAWPETMGGKVNQLCRPLRSEILDKLNTVPDSAGYGDFFGDGHSAERITEVLSQWEEVGC